MIKIKLQLAAMGFAVFVLLGCHNASAPIEPKTGAEVTAPDATVAGVKAPAQKSAAAGVTLTAEQIEKIGLQIETLKPAEFGDEAAGYGTVISHEAIAQSVAELVIAEAVEKQSRAALQRAQRLSGTAGAVSADVEESSDRQAAVDGAALSLARQRLSGTYGQNPPWSNRGNRTLLKSLASGNTQLVRVTFPLGALPVAVPKSLRAARIGASGSSWKMSTIWSAPADASVPGRSYFALLRDSQLGEGERIIVWAPLAERQAGVSIPHSAVVISGGKYWCYLEEKKGTFVRKEIDTGKSIGDGYFVTQGVTAGNTIVTQGGALLLAQESNTGADAD